ncbi:Protein patched [Ooceraea biroi]|uniref:Protein patched n=1 Tax=Ooceraea biroi TaxID=2015173 RepID=A0A026VU87_OOCBI|nr:Protein patched [Ooceraea biroi]
MVSASGPISTGILAGRPSGSQGPRQHGSSAECEKDARATDSAKKRHESDLYVRPSWTDAAIALDQLEKVESLRSSCGYHKPLNRLRIAANTFSPYIDCFYASPNAIGAAFPRIKIQGTSMPKGRPVPFILAEGYTPTRPGVFRTPFIFVRRARPIPGFRCICTHVYLWKHESSNRVLRAVNFTLQDYSSQALYSGKAEGQRSAVWIRARLQDQLSQLGFFLQRHAGKALFVAILALATFCVPLKSAQVYSKVDQLWVQEGGRLQKELTYASEALGEAAASTHQLVIQTPRHSGANILHPAALKEHLAVLKAATQVTVHLFDITWRLKDLCYAPSIPNFDLHYIDQIFDSIIPCAIITPLDCFWEGSKLLGPEYPVHIPGIKNNNKPVRWTNLNPSSLLNDMKKLEFSFPFKTLEDYMKRAGITNGYQSKPCLNPADAECPETAPNKKSQEVPDVGVELTGGCYGFAAKYMHWPEELVVGGAKHNKTGHLTRAAALQTVVQLMGERELYDFLANTYKVHHIDWSQEKAAQVLETWQRAFSNEVKKLMDINGSAPYNLYAFSTTTMNDILGKYSEVSVMKIAIGCGLMLLYAGIALFRWKDPVRSQSGVGIVGVILVCATVAAGLGFCALLGIPFNATTTQIVPFLALGLGVHDMFLTYAELSVNEVPSGEQTGVVLKRTGLSVLLAGISNVSAFFAAAIIPIPALRTFCLQAGILLVFNLAAMLLIFPAMVSLDLRRRRSGRRDILCCCLPTASNPRKNRYSVRNNGTVKQTVTRAIPPERRETCTQILTPQNAQNESWIGGNIIDAELDKQCTEEDALTGCSQDDCLSFSFTQLAARHYAPFISRPATKVFGMIILVCVLAGSVWQTMRVRDGLDLTDLVPQNSNEYAFLSAQAKHFGFYNMYAVTGRDFEYPNNQRLLYEYHDAFMRIKNVFKNDNGGLPEFWLGLFRDWLKSLQTAFDKDYNNGCITQERWYKNASDEAILAYKLLVQTGYVDNPIDKTLITQVRLVDSEGIINPRAFYNYLSAWASNDALAYGASQANLRPEPRQWIYTNDHELKIPKSMPLTYAQMPFSLHKLTDTQEITELISSVRKLCKRFEERGLPNFPSGIPFLFWEQYLDLRSCLGMALLAALGASVIVVGVLLLNVWAAILVGLSLAAVVLQLLGIMGLCNIKLSAVPAVLLVVSVGIAVHFMVHICLSFVTSVGSRDRRMRLALEHMYAPVIHGALTTLLAVMMLAFSEFEFIVNYFFLVLLCVIGIGLVNGIFFFPILLSLIGPSAEVIPNDHPDRISTPTPPPSPVLRRSKPPAPPRRSHKIENARLHAEPSLTTITEEPNSWHSTQDNASCIIVQPELKVETTSTCGNQNCSGSDTSGSSRTSPVPSTSHITTKVTATANIKVEVHTPLTSGVDRNEKCRHAGASSRRSSRCSTNVNAGESSGSGSEPDSDSNPKH